MHRSVGRSLRALIGRAMRFGFVGASGFLVNNGLLVLWTEVLGVHYLVGAGLATQGSTSWNFVGTEVWVFRNRETSAGRWWQRLWRFFAVNNAALLLRGPILFVFTSVLGLHYVASNVLSLGVLFVARFLLADAWIWRAPRTEGPEPAIRARWRSREAH